MKKQVRYLQEKNGYFFARLRVPKELRPYVGKTELLEGLGSDPVRARRYLEATVARLKDRLESAREEWRSERSPPPSTPRQNQRLSLRHLAAAHYAAGLELDEQKRAAFARGHLIREDEIYARLPNGEYQRDNDGERIVIGTETHEISFKADDVDKRESLFRPTYERLLRDVVAGRSPDDQTDAVIGWAIDGFKQRGNTDVEYGTDDWRKLASTLAGVQLEIYKRNDERNDGNISGQPAHPSLTIKPSEDDPLKARILGPDSMLPLSNLIDQFLAERNPGVQAQHEHRNTVRTFEEFLGDPKPVYSITRGDVNGFKRVLAQAPAHFRLKFPGTTLPQAIEANKKRKEPFPLLNAKTINDNQLAKLGSFLNWCAKNDIIPDNPASGIKVDTVKSKEKERLHFNPDDLGRLFGEHFHKRRDEFRWAMLVALYTGMRPSEVAQLKLNSIRTERGVLCFIVEEETKNVGSQREIPIHSKLKALGLEARITQLRTSKQTHLFPEWYQKGIEAKAKRQASGKPETINEYWPRYIPKQFNVTHMKKVGVTHSKKAFYSFRHTFNSALKAAGVSRELRFDLLGREDHSSETGYLHDYSIEERRKAVECVVFDGFPL